MSHFSTLVLIPADTAPALAHDTVAALLAKYDENLEVAERDEPCYCVGKEAERFGAKTANEQAGSIDELRTSFASKFPLSDGKDLTDDEEEARDKLWEIHISDHRAIAARSAAEHPMAGKPEADCDECKGGGTVKTTGNPDAKWDWWMIGGRWSGLLSGYNPDTDPKNLEVCFLCHGTGKRNDALGAAERVRNPAFGCNGCNGKGKSPMWPSKREDHPGDIVSVETVLATGPLPKAKCPFAVVEPDGSWHQKGRMGWWGIVTGRKDPVEWLEGVNAILARHRGMIAVVCDLHI